MSVLTIFMISGTSYGEVSDSDKKPLIEISKSAKIDKDEKNGEKRYIVLFKDRVEDSDIDNLKKNGGKVKNVFKSLPGLAISADDMQIQKIKSDKRIKNIVEDTVVHTFLSNSVPHIGANSVHAAGVTGNGIKVCIVDTGVDDSHPSLNPLIAQYDYVNNDGDATDDEGHGTHVAGIVASRDSVYKGVAPDTSLMAVKVLDSTGSGFMSTVIVGIDWCIVNGADVINLSLGGGSFTNTCDGDPSAIAVNNAVAQGVVVVAASGNNGYINAVAAPACASQAIAVGAVDNGDGRTSFSNEGPQLDVVAPGVSIVSLNAPVVGGGFTSKTGTSMATPHVAGLVALLLETNPSLSPIQIISAIKNTSLDLGAAGFDTIYGFGRIQAYNAYQSVVPLDVSVVERVGITDSIIAQSSTPQPPAQYISQATGQVNILGSCGLSFPNGNNIHYGSLTSNTISPEIRLNMTNSGTTQATLQVSGTNWLDESSSSQMFVNRTYYGVTSGTYFQKTPLQAFNQLVTSNFIPAVTLQTFWQLQAILLDPSFTGITTQTMDFTVSC
ncbi:MAG: hypothetical protein EPO62_08830 [Candidatus Nitrosotenuis sp.]|nr:MAG: hypothetical protein EPO62_08830 [Candidatus Nitrosotenuis sp.]